jgi:hypothetical protein
MNVTLRTAFIGVVIFLASTPDSPGQISFSITNVGSAPVPATLTNVSGGYDLAAAGTGIQGTSDQFTFAYQILSGDFDLEVRLGDLGFGFSDAWAQAGLIARDGLASNSRFAGVLASPGPAGSCFASRVITTMRSAGWFPVNYPDTWLRLQRTGDQFTGFASFDGQNWEYLSTTNIVLPTDLSVGLALSSGKSNATSLAQFRDYGNGSGVVTTNQPVSFEPLAACSRRTALVFTEIMYHAQPPWTTNLQFVELYNSGTVPEDLTGHRLSGDIDFAFPSGTTIVPGQFLVVAKDPSLISSVYGVNALGPFTGNLPNDGGTLRLISDVGGRLLEVNYDTKWPWPVAADGGGHSLVMRRPSYGENNALAWAASDVIGGSPGEADHYGIEPARNITINEFLAHTDLPQVDFVELYNHGNSDVDLSGCFLSDKLDTNRFQFPTNTWIPARGFLMLDENQLGFRLSAAGGKIILRNANLTRVLDAVNYDAQENGIAYGRWPDGADRWSRLETPTGGSGNARVRTETIVINELMYDPISGNDDDQYVELFNHSSSSINLTGWELKDGIHYTFPSNTVISAGAYIVVARNAAQLKSNYTQLNSTNTFGDFSGKLSGKGERLALAKPDDIVGTNGIGQLITNKISIVVDEVTYGNGGRWPRFANQGGSSIELIDPRADRRQPSNWADSDETQKAPWTTIDTTAILENGQGTADRFEFFLQDAGEVFVDNLEMLNNGSTNRVLNPGFESGSAGFTFNGTHRTSFVENGAGVGGSKALHLIAVDRGDAGPNKVWTSIAGLAVANPNSGTIRAQVRWLKGSRYIMFRPSGHWMEVAVPLNVPSNPGTPGLPNSRLQPNAGPAIYEVQHSPVLPAPGQPVVVTARAQDADGIDSLTLSYRTDPGSTLNNVDMRDDGTGGDAIADDGLYSATIPGQASGVLVAFRINARDGTDPAATNVFPAEAPARECLVRWGEQPVAGTLGTYRIWITEATRSFWASRERNANDPVDCTFVYGNSRAIYDANTLYSGSPFHTLIVGYNGPTGVACDYEVNFRPDEKFLGAENFVLSAIDTSQLGTFFPDASAQVEITGNWIARKLGLPSNNKRHVFLFVNGLRRASVYEDSQQPNGELLDEYFPNDDHGELRKIEDWFEFDSTGNSFNYITATLQQSFKTGGGLDSKRYRWNWRPRATDDPNNWRNFTNLITAVNTPGTGVAYVSNTLALVNMRAWLGSIAVHHMCGDWDSYGYQRGKNSFAYRPDNGGWVTLIWDIELCLGDSQSQPATDSIYSCHDPILQKMLNGAPAFQREYLGLMQDAINGPFAPGVADVLLDARYASLQRNGVGVVAPTYIKTFISSRRSYLQTQIPSAIFKAGGPVTSTLPNVVISGTAPISVRTILANSNLLTVNWTSTTAWTANYLLTGGSNQISLVAYNSSGNVVGSTNLNIYFTGSNAWPHLKINEWMASNTGSSHDPADNDTDDWFEIYNPTTTNVSLLNWSLTDTPTNVIRFKVPNGYAVPAKGYLLVWADDETQQNTNTRPDLHVDFKLDKNGEAIALFAPDGTLIDQVVFGPQSNDVSQGSWPNGGNYFVTLTTPTPGQMNIGVPPPVPILDASLAAGAVNLTVNSGAGFTYQLEWTDIIEPPNWTSLGPAVVATNATLSFSDSVAENQQRFYRAVLLP